MGVMGGPQPTVDLGRDLEHMTKAEIIEYAAGLGIVLNMRMTKAEMIALVEEG